MNTNSIFLYINAVTRSDWVAIRLVKKRQLIAQTAYQKCIREIYYKTICRYVIIAPLRQNVHLNPGENFPRSCLNSPQRSLTIILLRKTLVEGSRARIPVRDGGSVDIPTGSWSRVESLEVASVPCASSPTTTPQPPPFALHSLGAGAWAFVCVRLECVLGRSTLTFRSPTSGESSSQCTESGREGPPSKQRGLKPSSRWKHLYYSSTGLLGLPRLHSPSAKEDEYKMRSDSYFRGHEEYLGFLQWFSDRLELHWCIYFWSLSNLLGSDIGRANLVAKIVT